MSGHTLILFTKQPMLPTRVRAVDYIRLYKTIMYAYL